MDFGIDTDGVDEHQFISCERCSFRWIKCMYAFHFPINKYTWRYRMKKELNKIMLFIILKNIHVILSVIYVFFFNKRTT